MGMTPTQFLESFVEGNKYDCEENPGDVRRAFNAAVSASHFADHYFEFSRRNNPNAVKEFPGIGMFVEHVSSKTSGAFRDVRSIANAYKHLYTDAASKYGAHSHVNSCGSIEAIELTGDEALSGLFEEYFKGSEGCVARTAVMFTRKDKTKAEFLPALKATVEYWRELIYDRA
ncbi:MAG: hypothetical protein U0998_03870 [Moraxellaceae bacterium]|nr:hypothetical protein [Moraxellaceae bacterium]MDZ4386343.1 hypothetical protein [Moraxellaceae bacterium]